MNAIKPRARVITELWLVSERLSARVDHSLGAVHGLGFVEYMVLHQLSQTPEGCMRRVDLATAIGRTPSGVTRLLRSMEKIGLVAKLSSDRDARVSLVTLTRAGEERLKHARTTLNELGTKLTRGLGESQVDALADALRILLD